MPGLYLPTETEFDPKSDDFISPFLSKERKYRHFDLPIGKQERSNLINFSIEHDVHRFLPLLGFTEEFRRVSFDASGLRSIKIKKRPIRYASHKDSNYLQHYSNYISKYYDAAIKEDGTDKSILAYRKGGATNIHHAKSLFDEIRIRKNCKVFTIDISGFFDSIDHTLLKKEVCALLKCPLLSGHHFTIWRNITRYSWVETSDIDKLLGKKRERQGRICSHKDFIDHIRGRDLGLIRTHDQTYGIPQGTPISGLYANIYLRTFDREISEYIEKYSGSYRRYSDDIAIVMPLDTKRKHIISILEKFLGEFELTISHEKTECAKFEAGKLVSEKPLQYLGFTYDGEQTLIRQSSLESYRRKMKRGIHSKLVAAKKKKIPSSEVFRRELLSRYTHLGRRRNFLRYAYKAADILNSEAIKKQVKRHTTWFNRAFQSEIKKIYG
ncbi:MAG: antiviral reverse transcriptase Drt2 [Pseudomonadota bacterium]|nr:antiviral reverse transcriptase Drt2 [Pseudomonadota bacterium]